MSHSWNLSGSENYDTKNLVKDTLEILKPGTPVLVRMETLPRATLYAHKGPVVAKELLARLYGRANSAESAGHRDTFPLIVSQNSSRFETAFCVSIEARERTTTGISAADRAATVLAAIDPSTSPPISSVLGTCFHCAQGVLECWHAPGQTEAGVDLARLAGLHPSGVICEIMNKDGTMARVPELQRFARRHQMQMITVADLITYRMRTESVVKCVASTMLPTDYGEFRLYTFENQIDKQTHLALVRGDVGDGQDVLVRVPSQCLTGDVLHSARCDCGAQLDEAFRRIATEGRGVLLYLNQEGRGIGLAKIRAYGCRTTDLTPLRRTNISDSKRISEIMASVCRSCVSLVCVPCAF